MATLQTTIEVDVQAAEILRRASRRAEAQGQTLGAYLSRVLPPEPTAGEPARQREAWEAFVAGMAAWAASHVPAGYVADDSRESAYDDRT